MKEWSRKARRLGVVGVLAGIALPLCALAQGLGLKVGYNYVIGFQEGASPVLEPVAANVAQRNAPQKNVTIYRVIASAGDQQWYRVRMVLRNPQGGWYSPPGTPDVWVNLAYATWVQEVR
jgi:hypothetical protein